MSGVPETSPMMKQPGTFVIKRASRFGTLRGGIFFVVLTTMHAFGLTGHSTWQAVSSMHWSGAIGVATPVDDGEHVVRAGVHAGVAADAALGDDDRVRVVGAFGVILFELLLRELDTAVVLLGLGRQRLFEEESRASRVAQREREAEDDQEQSRPAPAPPRQAAEETLARVLREQVGRHQQPEQRDDDEKL